MSASFGAKGGMIFHFETKEPLHVKMALIRITKSYITINKGERQGIAAFHEWGVGLEHVKADRWNILCVVTYDVAKVSLP